MTQILLGQLRHILSGAGAVLVFKGYTDEATIEAVVGALMTLSSFVASWRSKT